MFLVHSDQFQIYPRLILMSKGGDGLSVRGLRYLPSTLWTLPEGPSGLPSSYGEQFIYLFLFSPATNMHRQHQHEDLAIIWKSNLVSLPLGVTVPPETVPIRWHKQKESFYASSQLPLMNFQCCHMRIHVALTFALQNHLQSSVVTWITVRRVQWCV